MKDNQLKGRAPAFQLYADDFIAGTADMTAEEVGGFIRLLCHQWSHGGIPADQDRAARIAGLMGSPCVGYVLAKFPLSDGHTLKNVRLEKIREEQQAFRAKQAAAGLSGAKKRWEKCPDDGDPNGDPNRVAIATPLAEAWPDDNSPSPSPIKDIKTPKSEWEVAHGVELPELIRTQNCLAAVKLWLQYKSEKRESYKKTGLTAALTKWSREFTPAEFPSIVEHSIASGWKGLYRPNGVALGEQKAQAKKELDWRDSI